MPTNIEIATRIKDAIDAYAIAVYDDGNRNHLGASLIGDECARKLWFTFRWCKQEQHSGRVQRLFRRGHREELAFTEYLRGVGFKVLLYDPEWKLILFPKGTYETCHIDDVPTEGGVDVTHSDADILKASLAGIKLPQLRISDANGHFGGSLDAILEFPPDWNIPGQFLGEFKTKGTGKGFTDLGAKGVAVAAPEHWAQMCVYGYKRNIEYALYFSVNKNDDDLHVELVKLDLGLGADMVRKATMVIASEKPPARISETITNFKCKWCNFKEICHNGAPVEKNCRSCFNAVPIEGGLWGCRKFGATIPEHVIKEGCPQWLGVI